MTIVDDLITDLQNSDASKRKFVNIVRLATEFLENEERIAAQAIRDAAIAAANTWWNDIIKPTLVWRNSQTLIIQRENIIIDYNNVKPLLDTETDKARLFVIREKLEQANEKFKQIKAAL